MQNRKLQICLMISIIILYEIIIIGDFIYSREGMKDNAIEAFTVAVNRFTVTLAIVPTVLLICSLIFHIYYKDIIIIKFKNNRSYIMFLLKKVLWASILLSSSYFLLATIQYIILGYSYEGAILFIFMGLIRLIEGSVIIGLLFLIISILSNSFIVANVVILFVLFLDTFDFTLEYLRIQLIVRKMTMPVESINEGVSDILWMGGAIVIIFCICILVSKKDLVKTSNNKEGTN
jgi:hypothetical protein